MLTLGLGHLYVVWSPHFVKDKELLETVQHHFTRMFADLKMLPYEERLR